MGGGMSSGVIICISLDVVISKGGDTLKELIEDLVWVLDNVKSKRRSFAPRSSNEA
jgi:hypothetical protein